MSFWSEIGDVGQNFVDGFTDLGGAVGDFFTDPLGALEDAFNATLDIVTLGTFSYAKDKFREYIQGLIPEQTFQDRQRTVRSATEPKTVIYGRARTGGQIVYTEDQGKDNILLWMCFVVAGHEVEEIETVYADGKVVATSNGPGVNGYMVRPSGNPFGDNILAWSVHGNRYSAFIPSTNVDYDDDSYDGTFSPPSWTSSHRLSYQSYVWINLIFDKETFGDSGLPRFTFDVKGKNDLYDPRTGVSGYSDNQALAMLDVLRWDRMFDESDSAIDLPSFISAANAADDLVASGVGTTEKRYTVNGTFKLQAIPLEILKSIASAGAATPYFDVASGKWSVSPGVYEPPVLSLDESDLVGGLPFQVGPPKNSRNNVAKGTYIDADQNFEAVGFEELYISEYVADDLEVLENSYDFPWTNSGTMARRLAKIDIERNRFGISLKAVCKFKAIVLTPGDRVSLSISRLGWSPKVFRVESVEISFESGVALELREDAAAIYAWEEGDALALDKPPAISTPGGMTISSPSGITFEEGTYLSVEGEVKAQLTVSWNDQPSALAYDLQFRISGDPLWINAASFWQDNQFPIRDITGGTYDVRVRAISRIGKRSGWTSATYTADSFIADPVQALAAIEIENTPKNPDTIYSTILVDVTAPADTDYDYAVIQYQKDGDPDWQSAGPVDDNGDKRIIVEADGVTYNIRAASVSVIGIRSSVWTSGAITITNSINKEDGDVGAHIAVPPVHGLEIFEQGNNAEFTGRDAKFAWRKTSITDWQEFGAEGFLGAGSGNLDQYFKDYQLEVWVSNEIVRTEFVVDASYVYTFEKNAEDYKRVLGVVGAWREFEVRVYCRSRMNGISDRPAKLDVSNTAPEPLAALSVVPGFSVIEISYLRPDDLDFAGVDIWVSQTQGFDPNAIDPTATVSDNSYVATGLTQGETYYVRLRPFDLFGKTGTNTSAEFAVTTKTGVDITGLSGWAYEIAPVDRTFIEANLAGEAMPSTKIENLTVAKLTGGVINATETITSEGVIRAVDDINNPQIQAGIGPIGLTRDGVPYAALMWAFDTQGVTFSIDELGNAYFQGDLEASTFTNDELTIDELGNLNSTGTFRFGGASDNFIDFNGTQLVIDTDNFSVDAAGNATFSGDITAATFTNDELSIDSDGNVDSTGTFRFGGAANNFIDFNGTRLVIDTDNFSVDAAGNAGFLGTITGSTITGSTLQTSATGARVVISSATNALSTYDSSNVKVASIGENVTVDGNSKAVSVFGEASAFQDYGIYGRHYSGGRGMYGDSDGSGGEGVFGNSRSTTGTGRGVYGQSSGLSGTGGGGLGSAYGGRFTAAGNHGVYSIATDNVSYDFYAAGGAGLNYGPFTGGHDCLLSRQCEFEIGDILIATGEFEKGGVSQTMPYLNIASQSLSKAAYGVFIAKSELSIDERHRPAALQDYTTARMVYIGETHDRGAVNALGEGQINVCSESGDFEVGDFICTSNTAGKGMRYDGQDMRYVVAKCMEPVVWTDEPANIKMVACIYMCG